MACPVLRSLESAGQRAPSAQRWPVASVFRVLVRTGCILPLGGGAVCLSLASGSHAGPGLQCRVGGFSFSPRSGSLVHCAEQEVTKKELERH